MNNISYGEPHQVLLTYIIAIRCINRVQLLKKFSIIVSEYELEITDDDNLQSYLTQFISSINNKLKKYNFKIDDARHQVLGESYYLFITTKQDEFIKTSTTFSPPELDAIKSIIDEIIENGLWYSLGLVNATQTIATTLNKYQRDAHNLITRLVDDGWIELTTEDKLILSIRSLSELRPYLIDRYGIYSLENTSGKILQCKVCQKIVTLGVRCINQYQQADFHNKCLDIYNRQNSHASSNDELLDTSSENLQNIGVNINSLKLD